MEYAANLCRFQVIVGQGTAMLDSDGGILNLKPYRIGYIYRASLGLSSKSADGTDHAGLETEMVFTRPLVLIRLAQFLQKIQVGFTFFCFIIRPSAQLNALPVFAITE